MITSSLEEYLKTMYVLKKQGQDIKVTTIANKMNCTKPSVNKAIRNLKSNGLVNYEVYGEIELLNDTKGYVSTGLASLISNGVEYYAVSEKMSNYELLAVVNSISTLPVGK